MRIKMQALNNTKYKSSIDVGWKIFNQHGIKGLYQGFYPTILGEVIGMGIHFGAYEGIIREFRHTHDHPPSKMVSFFAGGIAGCLSWLLTYPLDYIKTIIQSDDPSDRKFASGTEAALIKYEEEGLRTFFKGLGITMLRAFPVSGVGFVIFEYFRHLMIQKKTSD
jgi:solute carrier family 25 carnitine/acylcarnitine transporter 20/29